MKISYLKDKLKVIKHNTIKSNKNSIFTINKINKSNFSKSEDKENSEKIEKMKKDLKREIDKLESGDQTKITDFFKFMDENIQKEFENILKNKKIDEKDNDVADDANELLKLVKCPITEDNLEICEEGFKNSVIIYFKVLIIFSILSTRKKKEYTFYMIN